MPENPWVPHATRLACASEKKERKRAATAAPSLASGPMMLLPPVSGSLWLRGGWEGRVFELSAAADTSFSEHCRHN